MQRYKEKFTLQINLTKSGTIALVAQMVKPEIGYKKGCRIFSAAFGVLFKEQISG